jgi:hypothetical protein
MTIHPNGLRRRSCCHKKAGAGTILPSNIFADSGLHGATISQNKLELPTSVQAHFSIYQGSQNRKSCRYSITAAVGVTRSVSAIPLEKITEILCFGVRGSAQQRFDVKDFL